MTNYSDSAIAYAVVLLSHYGFELRGYTPEELVNLWGKVYRPNWIRLAVIEALYRGRYKAVSVEQILAVWLRRGKPIHRFNGDFERLISRKIPQNLQAKFNEDFPEFGSDQSWLYGTDIYEDNPDEDMVLAVRSEENLTSTVASENINRDIADMPGESEKSLHLHPDESQDRKNDTASLYSKIDWSRGEANKNPIHQFSPAPDDSGFYQKLKKVVIQQDEKLTDEIYSPGKVRVIASGRSRGLVSSTETD